MHANRKNTMSNSYGLNPLYPKPAQTTNSSGTSTPLLLQTLSVTTATAFAAFDINTSLVYVDIQGNAVYGTFDGSVPSSSNGHLFAVNTNYTWAKQTAALFKCIAVTGTAVLTASQFQV